MSKFQAKAEKETEVSTASLPDIVFLLLFYFMVSTTIKVTDNQLKAQIPPAHYLTATEKKFLVKEILIGFPRNHDTGEGPRISAEGKIISLNEIPAWVEMQRNTLPDYYKDKMIIMIRSDQDVEMGLISDVQQKLREASARKIVYRTLEKGKF